MILTITLDTNKIEDMVEAVTLLNSYSVKLVTPTAKKEVVKPTETVVEEPKPSKPIPKATPTPKKASKPSPEKSVSLADLKDLAKAKVGTSDRETVKAIIAEFAPKLSEVKESDYSKLAEKLA